MEKTPIKKDIQQDSTEDTRKDWRMHPTNVSKLQLRGCYTYMDIMILFSPISNLVDHIQ